MENYGTDKPDLRYEMLIQDYTDFLNQLMLPLFNGKELCARVYYSNMVKH
jgi:aspartyl-tRNA synthetase